MKTPMFGFKVCKTCQESKDIKGFRIRKDKRMNLTYYNNVCKKCEADIQRERYSEQRNDTAFMIKNRKRAKAYHEENREEVLKYQKNRRSTEEYKEYRKKYYINNKDKIREQHRNVCKNAVIELRDWYVVGRIADDNPKVNRRAVKENVELIEIKKSQILINRITKKLKNINNEKQG